MGKSRGYQCGHQRQAWDTKAAAAATKKPVSKHRLLFTPPLLRACAARHCQGPVIQGQVPQENTQHASVWYNVTLASATTSSPCITYPFLPPTLPEWARAPEAAAPLTRSGLSEDQTPSGNLHAELGPNLKLNPRHCVNKEEKGNLSQQSQERRVKSPQSTWCTLHLWNTWIDNASCQNWGSGFGEQQYTYLFPFSLFDSVYVYASLCDFVCMTLFLPFILGFCLSNFFVCFLFFSIVFSNCYHWWIYFLVWLLSSFFLSFLFLYYFLIFFIFNNYFYFNYFILFYSFFLSFFLPFLLSDVADRVLALWPGVRLVHLRWESWVHDTGPPETSRIHVIVNGESSRRNLDLKAKTQLHSTTSNLQCWTHYAKQLARQEHNPIHQQRF